MRSMSKFLFVLVSLWFSADVASGQQVSGSMPRFIAGETLSASTEVASLRAIRFVVTTDFPPFSFIDESGKLNGFNVYLAKSICSELKITGACTIQAIPFGEIGTALNSGQADAAIAGMDSNEKSRAEFGFTRSYMRFPARFAVQRKQSSKLEFDTGLNAQKIGTLAGSPLDTMARAYFPGAVTSAYASRDLLYKDLKGGKLDAVFDDAMRLSFWLNGQASAGCCIFEGEPFYSPKYLSEGMRIAVPLTRPDVTAALDKALLAAQNRGILNELYLRFFPVGFY